MDITWLIGVLAVLLLLLFLTSAASFYILLAAMAPQRRLIRLAEMKGRFQLDPPGWLQLLLRYPTLSKEKAVERRQLLTAAGIRISLSWYICLKRMGLVFCTLAALTVWEARSLLIGLIPVHPIVPVALLAGLGICLLGDRHFLESLKRYRTNRIVEEIYIVSRQLLYFSGSPLHLHGKLSRCLPYTRLIRNEWHLLLNQWYQDPEGALTSFRLRLGTEEAHGFAETLLFMQQYDGDAYYGLLRQRVQDYKERLEMIRDSRKESVSYGLFVVASIPILYTFQVFIYPWVQEGQRLFQTLN